jgi:hypothetical protein
MKKLIVLFIAIVFIATSCKNNKQTQCTLLTNPSPYIEKLNEKVEKVAEKTFWAIAEGAVYKKGNLLTTKEHDSLGLYYDFEATFDTSGDHLISCNYLDENNKIVSTWQFSKENNRLSSFKWTLGDPFHYQDYLTSNPTSGYSTIKCNDKGQIISEVDYRANVDTLIFTWTNSYNEAGDTMEGQQFDNKGVLLGSWINVYNDKGQYVGGENYDKDGIPRWSWEIKYNEKGFWSEWTNYDKDKKVTSSFTRTYPEYDAHGNWLKAITKDNKDQTWFSERTYLYYQ